MVVCGEAAAFVLKGDGVVYLLDGDKVKDGRSLSRLGGNDEGGAIARSALPESFGDGCLGADLSIESSTLKECSLTTPDRSTGIGEDCSSNGSSRLFLTTLRRGGLSNGLVLGPSSNGFVLCRRGGVPPDVIVGLGVVLGNNLLIRLVVVGSGFACL